MRLAPTLLIVALSTLAACGPSKEMPPPPATANAFESDDAPAEMGQLIPEDSAAVVYIRDVNALLDEARSFASKIMPGVEGMISLQSVFTQIGITLDTKHIDESKPMAMAFTTSGRPTFIMPAKDAADFTANVNAPAASAGSYVALTDPNRTPSVGAVSPLASALPDGSISIRVDLSAFSNQIRDARTMMRDAAEMVPEAEVMLSIYEPVFDQLLNGGMLDAAIALERGKVQMSMAVDAGISFDIAPIDDAMKLMRRIPAQRGALVSVLSTGLARFGEFFDLTKLMQALPMTVRDEIAPLAEAQAEMYRNIDSALAYSFAFGDEGMRMVMVTEPKDVNAARAATLEFAKHARGLYGIGDDFEVEPQEIAGATFDYAEFSVDLSNLVPEGRPAEEGQMMTEVFEKLYGNPVSASIGTVGDVLVWTFGVRKDDLPAVVATAKSGAELHGELLTAQRALGDKTEPWLLFAGDMAGFIRNIGRISESFPNSQVPKVPENASAIAWLALSQAGTVQRLDIGADLLDFVSSFGGR